MGQIETSSSINTPTRERNNAPDPDGHKDSLWCARFGRFVETTPGKLIVGGALLVGVGVLGTFFVLPMIILGRRNIALSPGPQTPRDVFDCPALFNACWDNDKSPCIPPFTECLQQIAGNEVHRMSQADSQDLHLPGCKQNFVSVYNGGWAEKIILPEMPAIGSTVYFKRRSDWDVFVEIQGKAQWLQPGGNISVTWNGLTWDKSLTQKWVKKTWNGRDWHQIKLTQVEPGVITRRGVSLRNIAPVTMPGVSKLTDMAFRNRTFINNTPYTVKEVYVRQNGTFQFLQFSEQVPTYHFATHDWESGDAEIVHMASLGNNEYRFHFQPPQGSKSRPVNVKERYAAERVQIYEKHWINAPQTFFEIQSHVIRRCKSGDYFSECANYKKGPASYVANMYFAQSVSGMTSELRVDEEEWGAATMGEKSLIKGATSAEYCIWMSPKLMGNMLSSDIPAAIDAEQGLIHEYYHNLGFSHHSGWPSSDGVDDLFGKKAVNEYRYSLGGGYMPSNLVVDVKKSSPQEYTFDLWAVGKIRNLQMRILSPEYVAVEYSQAGSQVVLKFEVIPGNDVFVSFYTDESEQMASVLLSDFLYIVSSQRELNNLKDNLPALLDRYQSVEVHTRDGVWLQEFYLPEKTSDGRVVRFSSSAVYFSHIFHDGKHDELRTGDRIEYVSKCGRWVKQYDS